MRPARLITRLFPAFLLLTVLVLGAALLYSEHAVRQFHIEQTAAGLEAELQLLADIVRGQLASPKLQALVVDYGQRTGSRYTLIAPDGRVLADSQEAPEKMENHGTRPEIALARQGQRPARATRFSTTRLETFLYTALPLREQGHLHVFLRAARPIKGLYASLRGVELHMLGAAVLIFALAALASYRLAARIARPLEALRATAEKFATGDLTHRPPLADVEEVAALAESMKTMARQLDERLRVLGQERAEAEAVLSSMIEGVIAVDHNEAVIRLNRAAAKLLGMTAEQAVGRDLREVVRNPMLQEFVVQALASATPMERDLWLYTPDERNVAVYGTALQSTAGQRIGALVVLNDVTRLRRLENVQREFVANVSHELKTPITAIKGFVETLLGSGGHRPEDTRRFLEIIQRHTERLDSIIEDLLSLARIEQEERGTLECADADLSAIVTSAIQLCRTRSSSKDIAIENRCTPPMRARVNARMIEQTVVNLLDNAIKFSTPGKLVTVAGRREEGWWMLTVRDQGSGIAAEHLPRLFERFYRVDKARSRQSGGTGLGLAIVKHIVQAHGGSVSVESVLGQGSTFTIRLPA